MSIKGGSLSQLGTAVERAKYDIYAVLAQNGSNLTWGSHPRGTNQTGNLFLKGCAIDSAAGGW